jgi:hypothetical protein
VEQPTATPMFYSYDILDKNDELTFELFVGSVTDLQSRIKHESIKHKAVIEHSSELDGFHTICFSQSPVLDRPTVYHSPSLPSLLLPPSVP